VVHAWADEAYRRQLIVDPVTLLREQFGVSVDPGAAVHVKTESADQLFIVIPDLFGYNELQDADFEDFISFVNQPLVIGSVKNCTVHTTESPWGCGPH
jgi:hypothetical protein